MKFHTPLEDFLHELQELFSRYGAEIRTHIEPDGEIEMLLFLSVLPAMERTEHPDWGFGQILNANGIDEDLFILKD